MIVQPTDKFYEGKVLCGFLVLAGGAVLMGTALETHPALTGVCAFIVARKWLKLHPTRRTR